jgi:hypothetical protein
LGQLFKNLFNNLLTFILFRIKFIICSTSAVGNVDNNVGGGGLPSWAQTFANASAVAVLAFLFLLNLTQVCVLSGRRRRRRQVQLWRTLPAAAFLPPTLPSAFWASFFLSTFSE